MEGKSDLIQLLKETELIKVVITDKEEVLLEVVQETKEILLFSLVKMIKMLKKVQFQGSLERKCNCDVLNDI